MKITTDPEVICTELENGDGVLLHLGTKTYFTVNRTGLIIWQLLAKGRTLPEISKELCRRFEVSPDQARDNVRGFVDSMKHVELVSQTNHASEP